MWFPSQRGSGVVRINGDSANQNEVKSLKNCFLRLLSIKKADGDQRRREKPEKAEGAPGKPPKSQASANKVDAVPPSWDGAGGGRFGGPSPDMWQ
eukprot:4606281-Prymnesium_polylepis.1